MIPRPGVGGVSVKPDPPVAGAEVEITINNDAGEVRWRIAPDGPFHSAPVKNGKARIVVPPGTGGKALSVRAGPPSDRVSERFEIVELQ